MLVFHDELDFFFLKLKPKGDLAYYTNWIFQSTELCNAITTWPDQHGIIVLHSLASLTTACGLYIGWRSCVVHDSKNTL